MTNTINISQPGAVSIADWYILPTQKPPS